MTEQNAIPQRRVAPNTNPASGIPHGFVAGKHISELICRIQDRGVNETYKAWKDEVESRLKNWLSDLEAPSSEVFKKAVADGVSFWTNTRDAEAMATEAHDEHFDVASSTFDIDEVIEFCREKLSEDSCFDEECYSYTKDGITYELGWLGGAQLLRISNSPYVTYGTPCSPCVPGGVNADLPKPADEGTICYCPDPAWWPWKELGAVIEKLNADGSTEPWVEPPRG